MSWKHLVLAAAALLMIGAGHKTAPRAAQVKPAPAQAKSEAPDPTFDARNPSSLIEVLRAADAQATIAATEGDAVILKVTSQVGDFAVRFSGCDAHGRACSAVLFDAGSEKRTATLSEFNRFNQTSLTCRMIQDPTGKPHILYSALVFSDTPRARMVGEIDAWRGCIADFSDFLRDPNGFLASAP